MGDLPVYYTCTPVYARIGDEEVSVTPLEDISVCVRRGFAGRKFRCDLYVIGPGGSRLAEEGVVLEPSEVDAIVYTVNVPGGRVAIAEFQRLVRLAVTAEGERYELLAGGVYVDGYHVIYLPSLTVLGAKPLDVDVFDSRLESLAERCFRDPPGRLADPRAVARLASELGSDTLVVDATCELAPADILDGTEEVAEIGSVIVASRRPILVKAEGWIMGEEVRCYVGIA